MTEPQQELKYNMPGAVLRQFEQWSDDHVVVVRLRGDVELNGHPVFVPLPYGRWKLCGEQLVTLTYYPPFCFKHESERDDSCTHCVVRSPEEITDAVIEKCTAGCISAGTMNYQEWHEKFSSCDDSHLKTVRISKITDDSPTAQT